MIHTMQLRVERSYASDSLNVYGRVPIFGGPVVVVDSFTTREVAEGERVRPFAYLEDSAAQRLMDDLWNAGLRPTEGKGSAGQLAATEAHLRTLQDLTKQILPVALRKP
jgi:hypothetical protein